MAYPADNTPITNYAGTALMGVIDHAGWHAITNGDLDGVKNTLGVTAGTSVLKDVLVGQFVSTTAGTETLLNKTLTSPIIGGTPVLDATSAVPFYTDSLYRQALINGNFDIWQRGTSIVPTTTAYGADRWQNYRNTTGSTVSRQDGTGVAGSTYCARAQRDNSNSATNLIYIGQSLETGDVIKFRGKKVTMSFYARKGANFSASSDKLFLYIKSGTGTDENIFTGYTNSVTDLGGSEPAGDSYATLTTSWQKFTFTTAAVLAATTNELGFYLDYVPVGTAGAADYFEITQVQLCAGDVALPFMPKSYDEEYRACLRYYFNACYPSIANDAHICQGHARTTTLAICGISLPTPMRQSPIVSVNAADSFAVKLTGGSAIQCDSFSNGASTPCYGDFGFTVASGLTAGAPILISTVGAGGIITFSAEL